MMPSTVRAHAGQTQRTIISISCSVSFIPASYIACAILLTIRAVYHSSMAQERCRAKGAGRISEKINNGDAILHNMLLHYGKWCHLM